MTGQPSLVRAVGITGLAASIVNVTIGGGIFRLPALVAFQLHAAAPLAFLVCAAAMGLIVVCFAEAGKRVDLTGGPYAYVEVAFGRFPGFLAGVLVWLLGTFAVAAVSTVLADSVGALAPSGEIKDVRRTVPRALLLAMLVITGFYLALQIVAQGVLGPDLEGATTPLALAATRVLGPWGGTLLLAGAVVSMFGYVSGM